MKSPAFERAIARIAPAYFAGAGQHVDDRLLLPVMVDACSRSRHHFEHAAPDRRIDTHRRGKLPRGVRSLASGRCAVEFSRAHDMDCGSCTHGVPIAFESSGVT